MSKDILHQVTEIKVLQKKVLQCFCVRQRTLFYPKLSCFSLLNIKDHSRVSHRFEPLLSPADV